MSSGNTRSHCPEVDKLMNGKMPFVTRYGITLVVLVLIVVALILSLSDGNSQKLIKDMIEHTMRQMNNLPGNISTCFFICVRPDLHIERNWLVSVLTALRNLKVKLSRCSMVSFMTYMFQKPSQQCRQRIAHTGVVQ